MEKSLSFVPSLACAHVLAFERDYSFTLILLDVAISDYFLNFSGSQVGSDITCS